MLGKEEQPFAQSDGEAENFQDKVNPSFAGITICFISLGCQKMQRGTTLDSENE
jgi:hypothetical protein